MDKRNTIIRNRTPGRSTKIRVLFVLQEDLLNQIRDCAVANDISVSAFLRESARRNLKLYERATV